MSIRERLARHKKLIFGTFGVMVLVAAVGAFWLMRQINPPGDPGPPVTVAIADGSSASRIAHKLEDENVLTSARVFRVYLKLKGEGSAFHAGEYELQEQMAMGDVVTALKKGPKVAYSRLTIPEGLTLTEIAEVVGKLPGRDADKFLELAKAGSTRSKYQPENVQTLEGLLFPDTYQVTEKEDEAALVTRLVRRFDQVADEVGIGTASLPAGLNPYEAIVAASLVETEAKVSKDRPLIASVIENRLEKGMKLQIDATVLYALGRHKSRVLYKDLEIDSPYNTYKIEGLPPTPIGASGRASLEAILKPAESDYIYYVLYEKSGAHAFAETSAEFEKLKNEARRRGVR
jgi:UPF0755 protein